MSNPNANVKTNQAFLSSGTTALRTWVSMAMLTAIAYVVMYVSKLLPQVFGFLQLDLKDTAICIGGFVFGPLAAAIISIVVALVEMFTVSDTGIIGCVMNILATASFCCTAAFVYKRFHTKKGAVAGLVLGVLSLTAVMLLWNYLITPLYMPNFTRADIAELLPTVFLPFNLVKGGLNMLVILLLYKPVVTALRKAHLIPESQSGMEGQKLNAGFLLFVSFLLATLVAITLVLMGII